MVLLNYHRAVNDVMVGLDLPCVLLRMCEQDLPVAIADDHVLDSLLPVPVEVLAVNTHQL